MVIIIIENKQLSEKELTHIFNLLKHPLRRAILKQLSKSPRTYSQILKSLNVQESSILNYHLREMGDLMIKKDVNGKYKLNEVGKICLQLVLKVKEKEDIHRFDKLQKMVVYLKSAIYCIQITFSVLVIIIVLELYLLNIIYFSSILMIFTSGAIFSILLSTSVFTINKKSENNEINNFEKKEKLGTYSTLFTIWILVQTILTLFTIMVGIY
ncbi:MAG: ArsR family transcriptional regulator [Promethearchaeota archaeon]|nr:MAG: ArsR family transcriptional regulator [Candidatus Lokiarchaeota archaeon]